MLGETSTRVQDLVPDAAEDAHVEGAGLGSSVQMQQALAARANDTRMELRCRLRVLHQTAFDCRHPESRCNCPDGAPLLRTLGCVQGFVNTPHCATKKVLESDSLPQIRKYSKGAELLAWHVGGKGGGEGGPLDARQASDHEGDGPALQPRRQAGARPDAR